MLVKCKVCEGKGLVAVQLEGSPLYFECTTCKGKCGFDVPENKELCPECNGKGTINVKTPFGFYIESNCENCFGTGMIDKG